MLKLQGQGRSEQRGAGENVRKPDQETHFSESPLSLSYLVAAGYLGHFLISVTCSEHHNEEGKIKFKRQDRIKTYLSSCFGLWLYGYI